MADQEPFISLLLFACPCGAEIENLDKIGLADTHEVYLYFTCPKCEQKSCHKAKVADVYRACPKRPVPAPKSICAPSEDAGELPQLEFTPEDLRFIGSIGIDTDLGE